MLKRYALAAIPLKTKVFYLLVAFFVAGVLCGAGAHNDLSSSLASGYVSAQNLDSAADNFFLTLAADTLLLFAVFLSGFSAIGIPLLLLLPFFKGLGIGAGAVALFNAEPTFWAVVRCIIGFAVTASISAYIFILAVQSALILSGGLFLQLVKSDAGLDLRAEGKKYGLKFLFFAVIMVINAVFDTLLSVLLYGF